MVSRIAHARGGSGLDALSALAAVLGHRLSVKLYPSGSPVRYAGQLRLLERLRAQLSTEWRWATEVLVGLPGDLRAWDLRLSGPGTVGIDAETRLYDLQALQRRCEAKWRDRSVDRVVLLVADTHHNRSVLREHRDALRSTFPLDTKAVLAVLRAGELPSANGIVGLYDAGRPRPSRQRDDSTKMGEPSAATPPPHPARDRNGQVGRDPFGQRPIRPNGAAIVAQ